MLYLRCVGSNPTFSYIIIIIIIMKLNNKKDEIQNQAIKAWIEKDKKGIVEIITGFGKTFIGLKALYTMPKDKNVVHLFLAEQVDRKVDLDKDIQNFNKIYDCDVYNDYNLEFYCYQTVRNWKDRNIGLVIADEVTDSISPENYKFYLNNNYVALIGLTALFTGNTSYTLENDHLISKVFNTNIITKQQLLDYIAPICFSYSVSQGQKDGTSRKLNIYIIESYLDPINKTIKAGNSNIVFYQTEKSAYEYINKLYNEVENLKPKLLEDFYAFNERKRLKTFSIISKRSKFLYNLPSKINLVNKLVKELTEKTIIFTNSLESLDTITKNVVSAKKSDLENNKIREKFDNDEIDIIGSFKKLKQGANLKGVDVCILMSYYGKELDLIQRIGRLRQNNDKIGSVFIFMTKDTQEEVWVSNMLSKMDEYNIVTGTYDDCLTLYKKLSHG